MSSEEIADRLAGFQIAGDFRRLRARIEQRLHSGNVVPRVPMPTVFGAVERGP